MQRRRPVRSTRNDTTVSADLSNGEEDNQIVEKSFVEPALAENTIVTGHRMEDPPTVKVKKELGVFTKASKNYDVDFKDLKKLSSYQRQCHRADEQYQNSLEESHIRSVLKRPPSVDRDPSNLPKNKNLKTSLNVTLKRIPKSLLMVPNSEDLEDSGLSSNSNPESKSNTPSTESAAINNDYCSCCGMTGMFLCCESCPKSYHFQCINPPIEANNLPDYWYCKECIKKKTDQDKISTNVGIFTTLFDNIVYQDPISFQLPKEIVDTFDGIYADRLGDYNDDSFKQTKSYKQLTKEFDDPLNGVYDKENKPHLCYHCGESGLNKEIITCDYCPLSWHLDCLDPPLTNVKKLGSKWKCPNHIDDLAKPLRKFKNQTIVHVTNIKNFERSGRLPINAKIQIVNIEDKFKSLRKEIKALHDGNNLNLKYSNLTFQINEENVILDFINSAKIKKINEDQKNFQTLMNLKPSLKDYVYSLSRLSEKSLVYRETSKLNLQNLLKVSEEELKVEDNTFSKDELREFLLIKKLMEKKGKDKLLEFLEK